MDFKKVNAPMSTETRDLKDISAKTGNIYESINIISKRANQINAELKDELTRKLEEKFEAPKPIVVLVETLVLGNAHLVRPEESLNIVQEDPTDNKILECAQQQGADYIVSGDHHLLDIGKYQDIQIVSPREFLETLKPE